MDVAVYDNVSTMTYSRPTDPGPYIENGPGDSAVAQADENDMQKEGRKISNFYKNLDATLKQ